MPKSPQRCSTNMSNSSNEPLSIRSSMRSRAVSLPRLCCDSMRAAPPPSRAWLRRASSFSRMSFIAVAPRGPARHCGNPFSCLEHFPEKGNSRPSAPSSSAQANDPAGVARMERPRLRSLSELPRVPARESAEAHEREGGSEMRDGGPGFRRVAPPSGLRVTPSLFGRVQPSRQAHDEQEHLGNRLVELDRDLVADLDLRQVVG